MIKSYAPSRFGQLHYVEEGAGLPVILLHQTPRSWDEYRDVVPLVGQHARAIAMDTVGFGASARVEEPFSIELFADGVVDLIDHLKLPEVVLVGHHTGGVIALEVSARLPESVRGLFLSGTPFVDAPRRARVARAAPIDHVDVDPTGAHLSQLWACRSPFYPSGQAELLNRFVADALKVIDRVEEGHQAVNKYEMKSRIGLVKAPTLIVCGELDYYSLPDLEKFVSHIEGAQKLVLPETGVPAVDHHPQAFAAAVIDFLARLPVFETAL